MALSEKNTFSLFAVPFSLLSLLIPKPENLFNKGDMGDFMGALEDQAVYANRAAMIAEVS